MINVQRLTSIEDWRKVLQHSENQTVLVFKHSTRCSISSAAFEEFQAYLQEPSPDVLHTIVYVVEDRSVSNAVAEDTGVRHESPQVIVIKNKTAEWHKSHGSISVSALDAVLKKS